MIYFVRHQAGGVQWQWPFTQPPNQRQLRTVLEHCRRAYGEGSPRNGPYKHWIESVCELGIRDLPAVLSSYTSARIGGVLNDVDGSGEGTVENP